MSIEDCGARLDELRALKRGWLDGEGEQISEAALLKSAELLAPHVYPMPDGGISIETDHYDIIVRADGTVEIIG